MYGFSRGEISADSITVLPWHESFSSIPDRWILVDEMRERERERVSHVDRVSLPQGPLVSNLLRFQKIVRPGWLFDVVGMTVTKRGKEKKRKGKKKRRKEKKRRGKERKGRERKKERKKEMGKRTGEMGKRERAVGVPISNWKLGLVPNRK